MARSGRFGRLPRVAPDLTSAIIAMMREYESYREQGIVDAWKNGGTFEGKPVTDEMVTGFYEKRLADLSPNDPQYENTKNTVTQYGFTIANSKQELAYAQHKVSDGAMVSFYTSWAAKMPPNSEAYRNLMRLAAQYNDRARAGGGGGGGSGGKAAAKAAAYAAEVAATYGGRATFSAMESIFLALARRNGVLYQGGSSVTGKEEDFTDLKTFENDNENLQAIVADFATNPAWAKDRAYYTDWIRKNGNPQFNGDFSWNSFIKARGSALASLQQQLAVAQKYGKKEDANAASKAIAENIALGGLIALSQPLATYEEAHQQFAQDLAQAGNDPFQMYEAFERYAAVVGSTIAAAGKYASQYSLMEDSGVDPLLGALNRELQALNGEDVQGPSLWDTGRGTADSADKTDLATTADSARQTMAAVRSLLQGDGVLTLVGSDGKPTTDPANAHLGVVSIGNIAGDVVWAPLVNSPKTSINLPEIGADGKPTGVVKPYSTSGVLQVVQGQTVTVAGATYDASGRITGTADVAAGTSAIIGSVYTMPDGTKLYGFYDKQGMKRYTYVNPFAGSLAQNGKGFTVTVAVESGANLDGTNVDPTKAYDPFVYNDPTAHGITVHSSGTAAWMMGANNTGGDTVYKAPLPATDTALQHEFGVTQAWTKDGQYVPVDASGKTGTPATVAFTQAAAEIDHIRAIALNKSPILQQSAVMAWSRDLGLSAAMGPEEVAAVSAIAAKQGNPSLMSEGGGGYQPGVGRGVPESVYSFKEEADKKAALTDEERRFKQKGIELLGGTWSSYVKGAPGTPDINSMPIAEFQKYVYDRTGQWMTDALIGAAGPTRQEVTGSWTTGYGLTTVPNPSIPVVNVTPPPGTPISPVQGPPAPPSVPGPGSVTNPANRDMDKNLPPPPPPPPPVPGPGSVTNPANRDMDKELAPPPPPPPGPGGGPRPRAV